MKDNGWYQKPGVKILAGKWQDFVEQEEFLSLGGFDVIYTDTFSENYQDIRRFFEHLPNLLSGSNARFSFFNGLGATSELPTLNLVHLTDTG
jgi:protein arginine N-methyltransferase 2